jgi:DNA-directed RNA polymerase subunit F
MAKLKKLSLIKGDFTILEARDILYNIFSTKINYHQRNNFSHKERFGKEDPIAKKRIPALKKELVKLEKVLDEAIANNSKLVINSEITILLTKD